MKIIIYKTLFFPAFFDVKIAKLIFFIYDDTSPSTINYLIFYQDHYNITFTLLYIYSDYKEYNTDTTIKFVVSMNPQKLQQAENEGVHKFFKLHSSIGLTSMVIYFKSLDF